MALSSTKPTDGAPEAERFEEVVRAWAATTLTLAVFSKESGV